MSSSPHRPLGIAVIGCGNFARRQHLPNLAALPGAQLGAVCDRDEAVARRAAAEFGAAIATTEPAQVWEDPAITAVVIAVPDRAQADLVAAALAAGKHVYVEKPAAETPADFARLIAARDRARRHVAVGFNKRFAPAYAWAAEVIRRVGGPHHVDVRMADDAWRWRGGLPPGSLLRHDACHLFDLAAWLTGSPVTTVVAAAARPDEDALLLRHANGATGTVFEGGQASMDLPKERVEAFVERGAVAVEDYVEARTFGLAGEPAVRTFPGRAAREVDRPWVERLGRHGLTGWLEVRRELWKRWQATGRADILPNFLRDQGWAESLGAFVAALREGRPPPHATLEDARAASAVVDAAERSRAGGTVENVATA